MAIIKISQSVPASRYPSRHTPYVFVQRATASSASGGKEYIVAVYRYDDDKYGVMAWHGSIRSSILIPQWKGEYTNLTPARVVARETMRGKTSGRKTSSIYNLDESPDLSYIRRRIVGLPGILPPGSPINNAPVTSVPPVLDKPKESIGAKEEPTKEDDDVNLDPEQEQKFKELMDLIGTNKYNWYKRSFKL